LIWNVVAPNGEMGKNLKQLTNYDKGIGDAMERKQTASLGYNYVMTEIT